MIKYNVGIYIRLSKEDMYKKDCQESESIINQRRLLLSYIEENRLHLVAEYVDDGYSGTNFDRPGFKKMMSDIKDKKINMIITKDLSRLGRDYIKCGYYLEDYFPTNNIRYVSLLDNIDTYVDNYNNDIVPFKALFNDFQSKDTSKKIKAILRSKKEQGLFLGSSASFGYVKDPKNKHHLIIDNLTAPIVKMIFSLAYEGKSNSEICMILNKQKIPTPLSYKGKKVAPRFKNINCWTNSSVHNILSNYIYTGSLVQGVQKKVNYKSKKRIKVESKDWIIVDNTHEPIISKEIYNKVNKINYRHRSKSNRKKLLLEGLIFCKECGCLMGVKQDKRNPNKVIYNMNCNQYSRNPQLHLCSSHFISYSKLQDVIIKCLRKYISRVNLAEIRDHLSYSEKFQEQIISVENEKRKMIEKLNQLYDDKVNNKLDNEIFKLLTDRINFQISLLDDKLDKLVIDKLDMENTLDISHNRELVFKLINKITVSKNKELDIYYNFI